MSDLLSNLSPQYLEFMHSKFLSGKNTEIPASWSAFFEGRQVGQSEIAEIILHELELRELIEEFRMNGHKCASVNIFEDNPEKCKLHSKLDNFEGNTKYLAPRFAGLGDLTTEELKSYLKNCFTGNIGVEFAHIIDTKVRQWLEEKLNPSNFPIIKPEHQRKWLEILVHSTKLEEFLQLNYLGKKRFSLEGAEVLICALEDLATISAASGIKEIELAMSHRGRINVLANVIGWPLENVLSEFEEIKNEDEETALGDVKYHLGFTNHRKINGKDLQISLAFNPSHLEFVYPVILGKVRAKIMNQYYNAPGSILPIIIHGEAALVGQGIVMETLNFSELKPYTVGGSIHIILNNQLGFTANASETRSSIYCTDFAKALDAPIFHVNGNDVESVCTMAKLAFEFRQEFARDIFIEICCYRKHGHSEMDEPRYTNPKMYRKIQHLKSVGEIYKDKLLRENTITQQESDGLTNVFSTQLEEKRKVAKDTSRTLVDDSFQGIWEKFRPPNFETSIRFIETPISITLLDDIIKTIHTNFPETFQILPKLSSALEKRYERYKTTKDVIWSLAELISFGSLLFEGYSVRLVGQDSVRGTFSQRHMTYFDQETEKGFTPLTKFENNSSLEVYNSPLSENAALGFEFGHSLSAPKCLTLWEAQYGDFANGAQVIVDQFIASSEKKWKRASGLVLLLPHGNEGQGPDHSSGRIERFLQLCGQLNIQVTQPSTAAQYFHLLRRQMHRDFRKPLIIFTPKSMLRSELNASAADLFLKGGFLNILSSNPTGREKIGLVCSGKIYWELHTVAKNEKILDRILFICIEQFYPLDIMQLKNLIESNGHINEWSWVQEEPQNAGGWFFIKLNTLSIEWNLKYIGRPMSSVPAEGNSALHKKNQQQIINHALKKAR